MCTKGNYKHTVKSEGEKSYSLLECNVLLDCFKVTFSPVFAFFFCMFGGMEYYVSEESFFFFKFSKEARHKMKGTKTICVHIFIFIVVCLKLNYGIQ